MRSAPHEATGDTPFFLHHGFDIRTSLHLWLSPQLPRQATSIEKFKDEQALRLKEAYDLATAHMAVSRDRNKANYDQRREDVVYQPRELVKMRNFPQSNAEKGIAAKFAPTFVGPYRIMQNKGQNTYLVRHIHDPRDERVVNVTNLRKYFAASDDENTASDQGTAADRPATSEPDTTTSATSMSSPSSLQSSSDDSTTERTVRRPKRIVRKPSRYQSASVSSDSRDSSSPPRPPVKKRCPKRHPKDRGK